jgi:hypothetical protein
MHPHASPFSQLPVKLNHHTTLEMASWPFDMASPRQTSRETLVLELLLTGKPLHLVRALPKRDGDEDPARYR